MGIARIIYVSQATSNLSAADFAKLVNISSSRNSQRKITGALIYCGGFFLQLLEGDRAVITERFNHISRDGRHHKIQLLSEREISVRSFANWDMSLLHESEMGKTEKIKFGKIISLLQSDPNLDQLGDSANQVIDDFKSSIERQSNLAGLSRAA